MTPPKDRADLVRVMAEACPGSECWPSEARAACHADNRCECVRVAKSHIAAIEAAGCRVVPVEATAGMCAAYHQHSADPLDHAAYRATGGFPKAEYQWAFMGYRAMLAASPFAPEVPDNAG